MQRMPRVKTAPRRKAGSETIQQILNRWPLESMLARCGIEYSPKRKFSSPFRPDRNPSCDIYDGRIYDRTTNESWDSIAVFAETHRISNSQAIGRLAAELPGRKEPAPPRHQLVIPPTHYSKAKAHAVAINRGLSPHSTEMSGVFLGTLSFAEIAGFQSWILSDASKRIAEARRIDGKPYPEAGNIGERKSHTLRGSCKSWPLGLAPRNGRVTPTLPIILVEGGPDYLAACDLLAVVERDFLPVAMLGAGQNIHSEALGYFMGRDVRILAHPDEAGATAARKWGSQLVGAGASVTAFQLEGGDLNDLVRINGADVVAGEVLA
jgi:hypothetical protein